MRLTEAERIEILMMIGFGDRIRTHEEVRILFSETHPNRPPISQSTVSRIENKFREFGHVRDKPKTGRPLALDENRQLDAMLMVQENPHSTLVGVASHLNTSKNAVYRLLHKEKFHPYKVHLVQELSDDDFDRRAQFCETMMELSNANPAFIKNILFSDEATFCLNGTVNKQNCRYWAVENPHWMIEANTQYPQKVNVWAGIMDNRIIGPYFFVGTLDGEQYLDFLQFELIPALAVLFPNAEDPDSPDPRIWLQQDGAPPHYARPVREYLDQIFPNRWIGRRGPIEWPARSPDLTPLDYFLWGYLKAKIYFNRPPNIEDLKQRIRQEIRSITPQMVDNVQQAFVSRLGHCLAVNGQQFEHLI